MSAPEVSSTAPQADVTPGARTRALGRLARRPAHRHNPFVDADGYERSDHGLARGLEGLATGVELVAGALMLAFGLGMLAVIGALALALLSLVDGPGAHVIGRDGWHLLLSSGASYVLLALISVLRAGENRYQARSAAGWLWGTELAVLALGSAAIAYLGLGAIYEPLALLAALPLGYALWRAVLLAAHGGQREFEPHIPKSRKRERAVQPSRRTPRAERKHAAGVGDARTRRTAQTEPRKASQDRDVAARSAAQTGLGCTSKQLTDYLAAAASDEGALRGASQRPASRSARKPRPATPVLDEMGVELTAETAELPEVIGQDGVIEQIIEILCQKTAPNAVLVAEPGVGKTATAKSFAARVRAGNVPPALLHSRVVALDLSSFMADTQYQGQLEKRLRAVVAEASDPGNHVILFLDELHNVLGSSGTSSSKIAQELKPALADGRLRVLGASTPAEYRDLEKDAALASRFTPVHIDEPSVEQCLLIMRRIAEGQERHHRVTIDPGAVEAAVKLTDRYIADECLPRKAEKALDRACSRVEVRASARRGGSRQERSRVTVDVVREVISERTRIPLEALGADGRELALHIEQRLAERVIGQQDAVSVVARAYKRAKAGLSNGRRPLLAAIFGGPTGTGKTLLAKQLAKLVFGSTDAFVRIDMSEYMEKHSVSRLIGSPPGYIGHDEPGQLTEPVRRRPYCVVLLDEIEKAHPDVFNLLLQVLDDGRLTDSKGQTVDFTHAIIIMTTNLGARGSASTREQLMAALAKHYRPEFLNRLTVVFFRPLSPANMLDITRLTLGDLRELARESDRAYELDFTDELADWLARLGYDPDNGARPLERLVTNTVSDALTDAYLRGEVSDGDRIAVGVSSPRALPDPDVITLTVQR